MWVTARVVTLKLTCLEPYYCSQEQAAYSKVACVALTLLFLGAGIAVLSQQVILVSKLKFIMGGYLMGLSLFPAATFAVLHYCKKTEERALIKKITPVHSKLYEQMITLQPNRVSIEEQPHPLLSIPEEVWNLIYMWCEPDVTRSCLSRLSVSFFKRFCFNPPELKTMGWHLGQLAKGSRTESTLQRRSFRNFFASEVCDIKSIQVVGQKIYVLEDRSFGTRLSAIMVWDMEQDTFTDDLLEVRGDISSFRVDGDNLYFVHLPKGPVELLDYLKGAEFTHGVLDFSVPSNNIDYSWTLSVWDLKKRCLTKNQPLDHYQFGIQVSDSLCATESNSTNCKKICIYNKKDLTLLHVLDGVYECILSKSTLFF